MEAIQKTIDFLDTKKKDVWLVDPRRITVNWDENPRKDYGDMESLERSIAESGVKVPVKASKSGDSFVLTHGYRRMKAVFNLMNSGVDVGRIPVLTVPKSYNLEESLFDHWIENDGKRLEPIEEAELFKVLIGKGYTQSEIAKKIGKTPAHVSNMVKLASMPKEIKREIEEGNISSSLVVEISNDSGGNMEQVQETISKAKEKSKERGKDKVTKQDVAAVESDSPVSERTRNQYAAACKILESLRKRKPDDISLAFVNYYYRGIDACIDILKRSQ